MTRISVIVPVYNTEKYLKRCLDSILSQTFKDYEIILVNDGSNDDSLEICKEYEQKHDNIILIDKENGGLSSARNAAIEIANGEFVSFVDSDDYIAQTMLEELYGVALDNHCDIVITKYKEVEDSKAKMEPTTSINAYDGEEAVKYYLRERVESVCTNLYSKKIIGETRFELGKTSEDIKFHLEIFKKPVRIVVLDGTYYFYYNNPNSITNGKMSAKKMHYIEFKEEQLEYYKKLGNAELVEYAEILCARAYNGVLIRGCVYGVDDTLNEREFFKETVSKLRKYLKLLISSKQVPVSRKILAIIICVNYRILKLLRGIVK